MITNPPLRHDLIHMVGVCKQYDTPSGPCNALRDVTLNVRHGEFVAVVGASGSGKSTFVNLLTGIDTVTAGSVEIQNTLLHTMNEDDLAIWRGRSIGLVFQFYQLLPTLSVVENVMLPMDFRGAPTSSERLDRALQLLQQLGIREQAHKLPADLSGGQQQRAAIARALANDPSLIVADEPTGNLDSVTATAVMRLFADLVAAGKTVIMVTHERTLSHFFSRVITLTDGQVTGDAQVGT